jgi:hypothetical protein
MITGQNLASRPNQVATVCWIVGLIIASVSLSGSGSGEIAARAALVVGVTLVAAIGIEVWQDWRAVLRPDIVAFCTLYFLTFFEFLFPQPGVDEMITPRSLGYGCQLVFIAFGTMAVARHWAPPVQSWLSSLVQRPASSRSLLIIFWLSFFFGYLYMLMAVNFNVGMMIDQMMGPRFTQPWGRDRLGNWQALLVELGAIVNLVPPLGGLILARREKYGLVGYVPVIIALLFCLFEGFASSTRNVLATYLITFLIGYGVNLTKKRAAEFLIFCCLAAIGFYEASGIMLETRTIGLKEYLNSRHAPAFEEEEPSAFFVDYNLINISQLTQEFPSAHPFLGWEVPYVAAVHPIPRAIWPGKPMGLSMSIESALEDEDDSTTLSATFVGESYMAGGIFGVVLAGIFFGILTGWWGRFASGISSEFGFLIYASGFLAIAISMRSLFWLTTNALPPIAAIVLARIFLGNPKNPPCGFGSSTTHLRAKHEPI